MPESLFVRLGKTEVYGAGEELLRAVDLAGLHQFVGAYEAEGFALLLMSPEFQRR